jgi:dinuclear metal center YbgI/SA1388 family protein
LGSPKEINIGWLCDWLAREFSPKLAADWDHVGLQVGTRQPPATGLLVCLEASTAAVQQALQLNANLILAHHPLIFKPIDKIDPEAYPGKVVFSLIQQDVNLYVAHTNLDAAPKGLNQILAEHLDLDDIRLLSPVESGYPFYKLVVFVPLGYENKVLDACFAEGAGIIGDYKGCSFRSRGMGTFRPELGANPFIGEAGSISQVQENRVEMMIPFSQLNRVVEAMLGVHPYEEPAYDIYKLYAADKDSGMGRIGVLPQELSLKDLTGLVREKLAIEFLRFVGDSGKRVKKVALCSGSGSGMILAAKNAGVDVFITGDINYHAAREAEELNLQLVDPGHFALEKCAMNLLAERLKKRFKEDDISLKIHVFLDEVDPFQTT